MDCFLGFCDRLFWFVLWKLWMHTCEELSVALYITERFGDIFFFDDYPRWKLSTISKKLIFQRIWRFGAIHARQLSCGTICQSLFLRLFHKIAFGDLSLCHRLPQVHTGDVHQEKKSFLARNNWAINTLDLWKIQNNFPMWSINNKFNFMLVFTLKLWIDCAYPPTDFSNEHVWVQWNFTLFIFLKIIFLFLLFYAHFVFVPHSYFLLDFFSFNES